MANFRKVFLLLTALLLIGIVSTSFAQVGGGLDDNLADFIRDEASIKIIDPDTHQEVPTEGGKYVLEDKLYDIYLQFREDSYTQFKVEPPGEANADTMQLPEGLIIPEQITGTIPVTIRDGENEYHPTVKYKVTTEGLLSIWFEDDPWEDYHELIETSNLELHLSFGSRIDRNTTELKFTDDIIKYVIYEDDIAGQAYVDKEEGVFDPATKKMNYRVKINSVRDCTNVRVTDTISGNALTLDTQSLQITDAQGNPISTDRYSKTSSPTGFEYNIYSMSDQEELYITYSADVYIDPNDPDGVIEASQASNKIVVKPDDGDPHQDETYNTIQFKTTNKSDGTATGSDESGNKIVEWTIVYNNPPVVSGGGDTITDTIAANSVPFMKYDGLGATLQIRDRNGQPVGSPQTIQPTYNADKTSWTYQLPATDELYSYEITYHTVVDMDAVNASASIQTLENDSDSDKTRPDPGVVVIPPTNVVDIMKKAVEYDTNEVLWVSDIAVPAGEMNKFVVTDTLPSVWLDQLYVDEMKSLEIIGLISPEHYTYEVNSNHQVVITFYKDAGTGESSQGINGGTGGRSIQIRLTTAVNQEWLRLSQSPDTSYAQNHTNSINVNDTYSDQDTVTLGNPSIKKTGSFQTLWDGNRYFLYDVVLSDVTKLPLTITDTFDTSILTVAAPVSGYPQMKVFGGNQWDQRFGETSVSYSNTPTGITITANTLPLQNDGTFYPYYKITYYLRLADGVNLAQYVRTHQGVVKNTARWGDIEDTYEYTAEYDALDKEAAKLKPDDDSNRVYEYVIEYNPERIQLHEGEDIELTDIITGNLSVDYTSITIETNPQKEVQYTFSGADPAVDGQEYAGGTKAVFTVPDETYVKITYKAMVVGDSGVPLTFSNTVYTERYREEVHETKTFQAEQSSGGVGVVAEFRGVKSDGYNGAKRLSGVTFMVYPSESGLGILMDHDNRNPAPYTGEDCAIITTDSNGILKISGSEYFLDLNEKYFVKEMPPYPEGYIPISFEYNFTLTNNPAATNYEGPDYVYFYDQDSFQIKNWPYESLAVKKLVTSPVPADSQQTFNFRVSVLTASGAVDTTVNGTYGEVTFTNGIGEFMLTNDQVKNIRQFAPGTKFKVEELDANGNPLPGNILTVGEKVYSISVSDGSVSGDTASYSGTTGSTDAPEIVFTNTRVITIPAALKVKKALADGQSWPSGKTVTFKLESSGAPMPAGEGNIVTLSAPGEGSFGEITYGIEHIGKTYEYSISEITGFGDGWASSGPITARVTVIDNGDGTFKTTVIYEPDTDTITNTYTATGSIILGVSKTMENDYWPTGTTTFPFTLEGDKISGTLSAEAKRNDPAVFSGISFDLSDVAATQTTPYTYTIRENCPANYAAAGVTCSTEPVVVKVTLRDNGDGTISPDTVKVNGQTVPTEILSGKTVYVAGPVVNSYSATGNGEIKVKKDLIGRAWDTVDSYTFTLQKVGDAPMPPKTSITITKDTPAYTDTFGQIGFTAAGTYEYIVKETKGSIGGITYDETEHHVTIVVKDDGNGHLVADTGSQLIQTTAFTNTYSASGSGEIKVKKNLTGRDWNTTDSFTFTLEKVGESPMPSKTSVTITKNTPDYTDTFGQIGFTAAGTYQYKVIETKGSIGGITYDETEHFVTIVVKDDGNGNLVADTGSQMIQTTAFTNTYSASGSGEIKVKKNLTGRAWDTVDSYTFTLEKVGDAPMPLKTSVTITKNTPDYTDTFGQIGFTAAGTYEYIVKETKESIGGITYDETEHHVTIVVKDDGNGNLIADTGSQLIQTVASTNTYSATGSGEIKVKKNLAGRSWDNVDSYTFTLEKVGDAPMPPKTSVTITKDTPAYTDSFGAIEFTAAGTYEYIVKETKGSIGGITYDETEHHVTIVVKDDGNGNLVADTGSQLIQTTEFTNTYSASGSGEIKVKKNLTGRDWNTTDSFTFTLEKVGEAPMPEKTTVTITKDTPEYTDTFGTIGFTAAGTYHYKVIETKGSIGGITYDETEHFVTIVVKDDGNGNLVADTGSQLIQTTAFTNTYSASGSGEIKVKKTLVGRGWDTVDSYTFTIEEVGDAPMPLKTSVTITKDTPDYTDTFGTIGFTAAGTYQYKVIETKGSIGGITYDETEHLVTIVVKDDGNGNLVADTGSQLIQTTEFNNTYSAEGSGEIKVKKNLEGRVWNNTDSYTFTLQNVGDAPMPAKNSITITKNTPGYTDTFGTIGFTAAGTYQYKVIETKGSIGGITYDETEHLVTIVVVDDGNGHLVADTGSQLVQTVTATNTYSATGSGEIKVKKNIVGRDWKTIDTYTFTLEKVGDAPMPAKTSVTITKDTPEYTDTFGTIEFTAAGTYEYIVKETKGSINGISYDEAEHHVTIVVKDDGSGHLIADAGSQLVQTVAVTNTFTANGIGKIRVRKNLRGRAWDTSDSFTFTLEKVGDAPMPPNTSVTITKDTPAYTDSFGTIEFTATGTYEYIVKETKGSIGGITYDETEHHVTIAVDEDEYGNLIAGTGSQLVQTVAITNTYTAAGSGEIKVKKNLDGRVWDTTDSFTFTLQRVGDAPMPSKTSVTITKNTPDYTDTFGQIGFTSAGTYQYKVIETKGSIGGITYDETEHFVTIVVVDDGNGNLVADTGSQLIQTTAFTNTYSASGSGEIKVKKNLTGRAWDTADSYTFTLEKVGDAPMPLKTSLTITKNTPDYTDTFGQIGFTASGTYEYIVKETKESIGGITYDETEHHVTIVVKDDGNGNLVADTGSQLIQTVASTNTYSATGSGEIKVKKNLAGRSWDNVDSYTFTLEKVGDAPMPDKTSVTIKKDTPAYTDSFGTIGFTAAGTYEYIVKETKGSIGGITYDETEHHVTIVVKDDGNGNLVADTGSQLIQTAAFTNTYSASGSGEIKVKKNLTGRDWNTTDSFTFTLEKVGEAPMPDKTTVTITKNTPEYTDTFGTIGFTAAGTYHYKVIETKGSIGGITYDETEHFVTIVVVDDGNGNLVADTGSQLIQTTEFNNNYSASGSGEIKVKKNLVGRAWDTVDSYTFTLQKVGDAPMPSKTSVTITKDTPDYTDTFGTIGFTAAGTYQYKVIETKGSIGGITYDETEHLVTIVVVDDGNGNLVADTGSQLVQTAAFTNTYSAAGSGEIKVKKNLEGRDWNNTDSYTFTLQNVGDAPMPAKNSITITKNTPGYTDTFGTIGFTAAGTYEYIIKETKGSIGGITYDETEHHVTIVVVDDGNGNLVADTGSQLVQTVTATNTYSATGSGEIKVKKNLVGRAWDTVDSYTFTLEKVGDAPMPSKTSVTITKDTPDYNDTFGTIEFTAAGTYQYKVLETKGNIGGITYDETIHLVTIIVKDDGSGHLVADTGSQLVQTVAITNTYSASGEGEIRVRKDLVGRAWDTADSFTFSIENVGDAPMPSKNSITITKDTPEYTDTFGTIKFTAVGTYEYIVKEMKGSIDGISYDETEHHVTIVVVDDGNGNLVADTGSQLVQTAAITNTYSASGEGEIRVRKDLIGRAWDNADSFTFSIENVGDAPLPSKTSIKITKDTPNYTDSFGKIPFTVPGTYQYIVKEIKGSIDGVTYDETEHLVTIIVVDDENGNLVADIGSQLVQTVAITNTYSASGEGEIKVRKDLAGRAWDTSDSFTFTIDKVGDAPMPEKTSVTITKNTPEYTDTFGKIKFTAPGTYQYIVKETKGTIDGISYDESQYLVTIKVVDDGHGNLVADTGSQMVQTVAITNIYSAYGEGEIKVRKNLSGRSWDNADSFTFTIEKVGGAPMPEKTSVTITKNTPEYTDTFGKIEFTAPGTYEYIVKEIRGSIDGISYDETEHRVTIVVFDDGNGNLMADTGSQLVQTIAITNTYSASSEGEIRVRKNLEGRSWDNADSFTFTIEKVGNAPMPEKTSVTITKNTPDYTDNFGTIEFTAPGTYEYIVKEIRGSIDGISYDETEHLVTIVVVDDGNGNLIADTGSQLVQTAAITNTYSASGEGEIRVRKNLSGRSWDTADSFTFAIEKVGDAPMPEKTSITITKDTPEYTDTFGKINFTTPGTYQYIVKEIRGSIDGISYDETEHHVTIVVVDDGNGNLVADTGSQLVQTVAITNTYSASGEGEIRVRKNLDGRAWDNADSFTFTIEKVGDAPMPSKTSITITKDTPEYTDTFGKIEFTAPGTYQYIVKEIRGSIDGISYDETEHLVTIVVVDDGHGNLVADTGSQLVQTVAITNTYSASGEGEIRVRKDLAGRAWDNADSFTFTIEKVGDAPMPEKTTVTITKDTPDYTDTFGKINFTEPGTYQYIVKEIRGSIDGISYDETEHLVTIVVVDDGNGNLIADAGSQLVQTIAITNTYSASGEGEIRVRKNLDGRAWDNADSFTFTIEKVGDAPMPEKTTVTITKDTPDYTDTFGKINFTAPGTYQYIVKEIRGSIDGISYDETEHHVTIVVVDDGHGNLVADAGSQLVQTIAITNTYSASGEGEIRVRKNLDGRAWDNADSFTFTIEKVGDAPMPEKTTVTITKDTPDYTDTFGKINFTEPGTYQYIVKEIRGSIDGITYDETEHLVTIIVVDDGHGNLVADAGSQLIQTVAITNTYSASGAYIQFHGTKTIIGEELEGAKFRFELLDGDGNVLQTVLNDGGNITFDIVWFTEPGTYTFTIREIAGTRETVTYDTRVYNVTVVVAEDAEGNLYIAETRGDDPHALDFVNEYHEEFYPPDEPVLPKTGFSALHPQSLPQQPKDINYRRLNWRLEIPSLDVSSDIVIVPSAGGEYPVTWLGNDTGLLEGYALPGYGSSIITGHNHLNTTEAGPFALLYWMQEGDRIFVTDPQSHMQIFIVYANEKISETDFAGLNRIASKYDNSLTMITCEDERPGGGYDNRRIIAARPLDTGNMNLP